MDFYWIGNKGIRIENNIKNVRERDRDNYALGLLERKGVKYTEQQKEAVLHNEGPALVLAVPGSGKTTVIIGRIANLILNHGINPNNILAITFSRAAALDMNKRFKSLFGEEIKDDIRFSTIHSFANTVVSSYNKRFKKNLILLKGWQVNVIVEEIYKDIFREEISEEKLETYVTGISYIKNKMLTKKEIEKYEEESGLFEIGEILIRYSEVKAEKNYYDYDDMLELCLKILKENKVTLDFLREKFKYILLDEGQDTSKLQFEIVRLLVLPKNNIFIVADDDQTIYTFRGADPKQLLNINDIFDGTKIYFMEQNFRSTKEIVEIANKLICNNNSRYDKVIYSKENQIKSQIELIYLENCQQQNEYLVKALVNNENDVALLYRNNISAIPIANILHKNNIQFCINNYKSNFFSHWILRDIMAIISLINNPSNKEALAFVYYKIKTYLNKNTIAKLLNMNIGNEDVFQFILNSFSLKEHEYDRLLTLKICFEEARKKSVYNGVRELLGQVSYMEYINRTPEKAASYGEIISTVMEILKGVKNYSEANQKIMELKDIIEESMYNKKSKILLSTFHGSKGLEFTEVYLLNILEDIIPSTKKERLEREKEDVESDRRLFYVGITRAKERLKILVPGAKSSIFVEEILKNNIKDKYIKVITESSKVMNQQMLNYKYNENIENQMELYKEEHKQGLKVGKRIKHKNPTGKGVAETGIIKSIDGNKIKIDFEYCGEKVFLLSVLMQSNLLEIL